MLSGKRVVVVMPAYKAGRTLEATCRGLPLEALPWQRHSDDFPFDNQILAQAIIGGYRIGEVSVPTRYFPEASSINFGGTTRFVVSFFRVFAPTLRIRRASTRFLAALAFIDVSLSATTAGPDLSRVYVRRISQNTG